MSRSRSHTGFTLVELLVVIGIIALLISILLPSLNRARRQANLVYCQSQLRQMWQTVVIYANENKGSLPWGHVNADVNGATVTNFDYATKWPFDWTDALSIAMGKPLQTTFQTLPTEKASVFRDLDTVEDPGVSPYPYNAMPVNHYTANSRMFPEVTVTDVLTGSLFKQRKLSSVKQSAETMALWDGGQQLTSVDGSLAGSAWPTSINIDQYRTGYAHCLAFPAPPSQNWYGDDQYNNLLALGTQYGNSLADVKRANVDAPFLYNPINLMRFRHLNNDTGNFCFADGHVESRKVGTVIVRDVCLKR